MELIINNIGHILEEYIISKIYVTVNCRIRYCMLMYTIVKYKVHEHIR